MKLVQLRVENFMSIGKIDIGLDKIGMNLVLGKNLDDQRFDSNGSAKSALFEAMTWGLFGEFLRDLSSEEVIRNGTSKVTVEVLVDPEDGGDRVWFTRYRTKKTHAVSAVTEKGIELFPANSVKDVQPQINTWLGLDFKTFTNSVYFGKGLVKFFMASNDAERKDLLETILQLVSFDDALERAKALSKKCGEDIIQYNTATAVENALCCEKENNLALLQTNLYNIKTKISKEHPLLKDKQVTLQETRDKIYISIGKLDSLISKEKELFDEEENCINVAYNKNKEIIENTYNNYYTTIYNKCQEDFLKADIVLKNNANIFELELNTNQILKKAIEREKNNLDVEAAQNSVMVDRLQKEKDTISRLTDGVPCKECYQNISIEYKQSLIDRYEAEIGPYYSKALGYFVKIKNIDIQLEENNNRKKEIEANKQKQRLIDNKVIEDIRQTYNSDEWNSRKKLEKDKEELNREHLSHLRTAQETYHHKVNDWVKEKGVRNLEVVKLDNEIIAISKTIADIEEEHHSLTKQVTDTQKSIDKLNQNISFIEDKIEATQNIDNKTKFWVEGFGPRGIKSFIFESALPYLTERTNHYSSYITGGTIKIDILPTVMVKSKGHMHSREKLFVSAKNQHGAEVYNGNSDGERKRIDICVLLALQDLISTRASKTWNTLIFDELFDVLDRTGIEHVLDLFRSFKDKSIFIISHSEDIKKHFDTAIIIQKKDGISSIRE